MERFRFRCLQNNRARRGFSVTESHFAILRCTNSKRKRFKSHTGQQHRLGDGTYNTPAFLAKARKIATSPCNSSSKSASEGREELLHG